ncbi:30S ribosomal protein S8e [Saccharolobus solfataricus]|uniref:Small ribosomal subunit protein eS8 n=3 Tax=Saccharolobus solfataricus TaxID=2287 RepID=RS8E_SACS2|nr:30S ribosomal protein S8e [Saccharolobus solfataricus]Q980W3.1 RecName: Full=Small ribosomal subunit protein eS8; AltName: Full=30S ribosomal protein S8e [Saccharolobus solfataricus P2]2KCO_A Chain A, 30S ribosomal protein S8e [Saccharolobus solfataricus P2]AAK40509.1 LSU ribosomal protein S8E (rps8E) [Saccharolobus solfataricus P2]AKA73490.1 30S ribosomal protein S8e [Saccharolobus solfataricus]AKA76188.1 30S ribosomal protein S8e [Saccharolobus solfataricus]AKA78880.1 30S ribosomal prote
MGFYQGPDNRKITGGLKGKHRDKRKYEIGNPPTFTTLSAEDIRIKDRTLGGNFKVRLKYTTTANVLDPATNTAKKVKILEILETPANKELARRGIIIRGAKIRTEAGLAVVTSRPGQDGVINAVLLKNESQRS